MKRNIPRLIAMYKSAAELGRIAEVHRTAVGRWDDHDWQISDTIQIKLLKAAPGLGLDLDEAAFCMGVRRCDCCQEPINREIRRLLAKGKVREVA
ncbi:MAG: hypothetical protein ABWY63_14290 [Hyphomicrobiaceae bacterium]